MATRIYCTYFDHNYMSRGLALYYSLQQHAPGFRLWVLCLTDACHKALLRLNLPDLVPCAHAEFEAADRELAATRSQRSTIEYYFTCTPAWMRFVQNREADAEWVTYLDGDLYFYSSPEPIYEELGAASVAIIPHRYTARNMRLKKFGTYNVGWVGARNDSDGRRVIEWWRQKCIEWCHDYVDGDRFADQGYLDAFCGLSPRVKVIEHIGANLAPWNIGHYRIAFEGGGVRVGDRPLIFFHFQGLRKDLGCFFFNRHRHYCAPFSAETRRYIYKPHVNELLAIEKAIEPILEIMPAKPHRRSASAAFRQSLTSVVRRLGHRCFQLLDIVTGRVLLVFRGRAY